MLIVHVGPTGQADLAGQLYALPHGRASILFMLVAGVGISLLAGSRHGTPGGLAARLAWRALLLLPLGMALQSIDDDRHVILQTYALMFLLAIGAVRLSDRVLLWLASVFLVAGPVGFCYGRIHDPMTFDREGVELGDSAGEILHALVLSGPYPLITWSVPFLLGIWLGRRDLRALRPRMWLLLGGGGVTAAVAGIAVSLHAVLGEPGVGDGWLHLTSVEPHSQMPLWLAGATATAVAMLGLSLMLADLGGRLLWPLVALGQVALTFYVAHLLALAEWPGMLIGGDPAEAVRIALAFTAVAVVLAMAWRSLLSRGPLEIFLQLPWLIFGRRQPSR